ncbi:MAG: heme NO-binding domain-containing protein [Gammaproteobacteria bacterium]
MKGIVFSEFVEMVEEVFSPEIADAVIEESDLPSGGSYTTVGTYDHSEILTLVTKLSEKTGVPVPDLVAAFGKYLFDRFSVLYPAFFSGVGSSFEFLARIEEHVHVEVRKLYPDADLPRFETSRPDDATLVMVYSSTRPFADLAHGLMRGCVEHYGETVSIDRQDESDESINRVRFTLVRENG